MGKVQSKIIIRCLTIALVAALTIGAFYVGQAYPINDAYAESAIYTQEIQPLSEEQSIRQVYNDGNYFLNIEKSGSYYIEVSGASGEDITSVFVESGEIINDSRRVENVYANPSGKGGYLSGYVNLKAGDVLYVTMGNEMAGASAPTSGSQSFKSAAGGNAVDVRLNGDTLDDIIMVAGGGGGASGIYVPDAYSISVPSYNYYYARQTAIPGPAGGDGGEECIAEPQFNHSANIGGGGSGATGAFKNFEAPDFPTMPKNGFNGGPDFQGGLGGVYSGFSYNPSTQKFTINVTSGLGGKNFVNTTYVTEYNSVKGISSLQTFKITFVQFSQITELDVMNLIKQNTQTPMLVVVAGIEFSFNVPVYDHVSQGIETLDTGQGEITIKNLDQTDGIIEVNGLIYQPGYYWIPYKEKMFYLQALESPDSSNITVLLN